MRRKKDKSNGITALYERLSRDDDNAGESNSIVHQKQMLEDYAMKHGFTNLVHFTDDGWSGATFDRPSWNRLVEGVKNGEITACICKDMSRIGRDHLQVGFFTDILFREKEVRFIAINNGIDSDRQETSEFAPFLNIMNEWFVRDTSKKIKAVLKSRGSSGNAHTSNIPPYGYLKDPENPDHWIIDEEAAEVVRRIYRMTIEGKGPYQIARELSEEKIERPSYYLGKKGLGNHASNYDKENPYMWRGNQVTTLIARPEYIGKTVNFRTFKNSYKDKKTKRADKEDWVVFDDTQEPIVDEETWLLAQKLRQNVRKADDIMDFAIFRLFIRVSLFVIALIACIIYLIKKRKLIYSIFFDKEAIKKEYTGKNDIIFLRLANTILVIVAILLILYLKDFVLDMPYIINKQYSYAEGYVTEQSHGGADISSERRSIFLYDKVKDDEIEITVFSRYIDKNTYLKVQYLPHTKYGAIVEIK